MPAGAGWVACRRQPEGRHEREAKEATGAQRSNEVTRVARSLKQIVRKVGTPRRRCPKHQARRDVSGIQKRLRRKRRTATARHPYHFLELVCTEVIVPLKLGN